MDFVDLFRRYRIRQVVHETVVEEIKDGWVVKRTVKRETLRIPEQDEEGRLI